MAAERRRYSVDSTLLSRPSSTSTLLQSNPNSNGSQQSATNARSSREDDLNVQTPADYLRVMKTSKNQDSLLHACGRIAQAIHNDVPELSELEEEEIIKTTYQVMINHPLNSNLLQLTCEVFWKCNEKPQFRDIIEEYAVFRPILVAIKNHKSNPYFLGTAMHALASIAESALSCKGLRQSQAYLDISDVLKSNLLDVFILEGGLAALAYVLRDDAFAQNNLLQLKHHNILKEIMSYHSKNSFIISNAFLVFRRLSAQDRAKAILLECGLFQTCLKYLDQNKNNTIVVTSVCGVIESLAASESTDFIEMASSVPLASTIFSCLQQHSQSLKLCVYGFFIFNSLCSHPRLLTAHIKLEDLLRFMSNIFETHENNMKFQEAFCRCLAGLFEASPQLHMFVGEGVVSPTLPTISESPIDGGSSSLIDHVTLNTPLVAEQIRIPLMNWLWVVLLSNLRDTQHYKVFESVCLAVYYLVVDSDRLRKLLLDKGAASAIYEGLRRFIGIADTKFENCLQYGCQSLVALVMSPEDSVEVKKFLVDVDAVYDLIDILDHHVTSPDVAAEALGVIACLSDNSHFRSTATQQNLHSRILSLLQYRPSHAVLVESAIEVLIIYAQDSELHTVFNEAGIFRELIEILNRNMGESVTYKCLMLIHVLADEEHLSTYPKDSQRIAWLLSGLLVPGQQDVILTIETLVCSCSLCKSCSNLMPQLLVECEMDSNLFRLLYNRAGVDLTIDTQETANNPDELIYELAIDLIHCLSLKEECRHKMLITAIKHSMIEAIKLLVDIGADINHSTDPMGGDSAIYQAVLTKSTDIVKCILDFRVTNRTLLKDALVLAHKKNMDHIIGLLLKALGLDKEKRALIIGGLNLEHIKPSWMYPSLGIHSTGSIGKVRSHRRIGSLDYVMDGLKRRNSLDTSRYSGAGADTHSVTKGEERNGEGKGEGERKEEEDKEREGQIEEEGKKNEGKVDEEKRRRSGSKEAEDAYKLSKSWDPYYFETYSLPRSTVLTPSRYTKASERQRRIKMAASRPPNLPTVISSPIAPIKLDIEQEKEEERHEIITSNTSTNDKFLLGSTQNKEEENGGQDEIDGGGFPTSTNYYDDGLDDDKIIHRAPQRRHTDVSKSMTGARHVAFNTLDMYLSSSPNTSAKNKKSKDLFSPGHVRRAAIRSQRRKKGVVLSSGSQSRSYSPFHSSEEGSMAEGIMGGARSSYGDLLASVTSTPKERRTELLSSLLSSTEDKGEGEDETDSPHTPNSTSSNNLSNVTFIRTLDMSANKLKGLETLVCEGPSIPGRLKELLVFDVKQNCLHQLPPSLFQELSQLKNLQLGQNSFSNMPTEIGLCRNLVELDLAGNQISSFPSEKMSLPLLDKFNLSNNNLTVFPPNINGDLFPSLRILLLESNHITDIEDRDIKLKNLQELFISKNSIKILPFSFLAGLNSLKVLDVSRNSLELIPGEAAEYTCSLQDLKVGYNRLVVNEYEFHTFIKTALVIQFVDGTNNSLMSIPPPYMWRSRGLKHLLLANNKISSLDLSDCNKFWPHLERLVLSENRLKEIPPDIGKLRTLTCLDISHNPGIRHLPNEMGKLDYLFYLNLQGLKNLDIDRTQNARAVVHYLRAKLTQSKPCYAMKMTVVGSAGKGKTTLLHLLLDDRTVKIENTATLGVQIRKWIYPQRPGIQYVINCWDFAGQEEFYSTHQCFLTPRSIYILVYNISKAESELDALVPWLLNIEARAPGSPVIVVGTHRDMIAEDHFSSVRKNMRQHINEIISKPGFPRDVTFAEVSCVGQKAGLDNLRNKVKEKIDGAKLRGQKIMGEMVPASYLDLANLLEEESKRLQKIKSNFKVIRRSQLDALMSKSTLTQKMDYIEVEQAVKFLHECGILLHYDDLQSNLSDLYFLDPQWLCSMMAKIITLKQLTIITKGMLHVKDLPFLLKGSQFPPEFTNEYIRLLEWFDVALQYSSDTILIPSYLPKEKPGPIVLPPDGKIVRRYEMCFFPPGFWPRLVVRLLSFPRRAIHLTEPTKQTYWYSGLHIFWSLHAYFMIEQLEKSKNEFDITVPNTATGIRLLCSVVDNVETLIDEWFPGLRNIDIISGNPLVNPSAICPFCPAYSAHAFPMRDLQQVSITHDEVMCPVHKDVVPLELLSPDIIISDLNTDYHVSRDEIIMDENNPATVLGKGGFGEVYKALYKGRSVAVKAFSPRVAELHSTTPNQLIRQEVSILSQLEHPNIIVLVGVCLRPKPMLLLEYAELGSLASFSPYSKISTNLKHRIALQVASALAFLHKNNVIYRDLKPSNILIFSLSLNALVNAKLSDYGISSYATATGLSQDIGTTGFKAPEILKAKTSKMPYNTMVDIYSYGIVLFQLVTDGHTPFEELLPHERDAAIEKGLAIKDPTYYGSPSWPDMHDTIRHCLQYIPSHRPSAQEIFDRMCSPEFMALRNVTPIHQDWEVIAFTVRTYHPKGDRKQGPITEAWLSSCDAGQQSMLSVINLTQKSAQPQGHMMSQNTIVYSMLTIEHNKILLGTNTGNVIVYEGYEKKEHRLAALADSVLCLCYIKKRTEGKSFVFAGLANGTLVAFSAESLQTPKAIPENLIPLNKGPVKGMKRLHEKLYVISGLEVFVINLNKLNIEMRWMACDDVSRKFMTCIEVEEDIVWTSYNNSSNIQAWDTEDGSYRMTINTFNCLPKVRTNSQVPPSPSSSLNTPDQYSSRVTSMYLQPSIPSLLWVGIASGHLMIFDTTTGHPLMITKRHSNAIRSIQSIRTTTHERPVNVVLTCGLGFTVRPPSNTGISFHHDESSHDTNSLDRYGVLLLWDCSMSQVKPTFDQMRKQQHPYR